MGLSFLIGEMAVLKQGGARGKDLGPGRNSADGIYSGSLGKSFPGHSLSFPLHKMTWGAGWGGGVSAGVGLLSAALLCFQERNWQTSFREAERVLGDN